MSHFAQFEAFIRIVPAGGASSKRFDFIRDMQRIAVDVQTELVALASTTAGSNITLASPGGGQFLNAARFSTYADGVKVKPQFGETPAQLEIVGYYNVSTANVQPHPNTMVFVGGSCLTGPVSGPMEYKPAGGTGYPVASVWTEVKNLQAELQNAITAAYDASGAALTLFRLIYKGIVFGDRGIGFGL